jgi:hypothetical protein
MGVLTVERIVEMREIGNVGMLASANVGAGALNNFLNGMEPVIHLFVGLGQIAVAVVTVWYVWKKIKCIKAKKEKNDES